jgi:hypothetical protein
MLLAAMGSVADAASPVFDSRGFNRNREFFSELPYEHIDTLNGNLLLTFTDLVLPGNAGFDLKILRTYNSKIYRDNGPGGVSNTLREDSWAGVGWELHMGRVFHGLSTDSSYPVVEMPDGSRHAMWPHVQQPPGCGQCFISRDYWIYDKNTHILKVPNGVVYQFGPHNGSINNEEALYAESIKDPFENEIRVTYDPTAGAPRDGIQKIEQFLGGGQVRTVTFTSGSRGRLETMTYNGRVWRFLQDDATGSDTDKTLLREVRPPVCAAPSGQPCVSWRYDYAERPAWHELTGITTPSGGRIDFTFVAQQLRVGFSYPTWTRVVSTRAASGPGVPGGTTQYAYAAGTGENQTTVTSPCGPSGSPTTTTYTFSGVGNYATTGGAAWRVGLMTSRALVDNPGTPAEETLEQETLIWRTPNDNDRISPVGEMIGNNVDTYVWVPLVAQRTLTRGTSNYTTTNTYNSALGLFNDFGRPATIAEAGELSRTTTRTFDYSLTPYIKDRLLSETITEPGSESFTKSYVHSAANGFRTFENIYGITTTYAPTQEVPTRGNVWKVIDGRSKVVEYTYSWGLASVIKTPEFTVTRGINPEGTIASETRRGIRTDYLYDALLRPTTITPKIGNPTTFIYSDTGTSIQKKRGNSTTTTSLDGMGRPTLVSNTVNVATRTGYDACGRAAYQGYPYTGQGDIGTSFVFDGLGRVKTRTNPGGPGTPVTWATYTYTNGVDVTIRDENNRNTVQNWSAYGNPSDARLMAVTDAGSGPAPGYSPQTTTYTYHPLGGLKTVQPQAGPVRTWTYKPGRNQVDTETHPESGLVSYTYDLAGNVETRNHPAKHGLTVFIYDGNNRLKTIDQQGNGYGSLHDVYFDYDDSDNRTYLKNGTVQSDLGYDDANRLKSRRDRIGGTTFTTGYEYYANDTLKWIDYHTGTHVEYVYDNEDRLTRVWNGVSGAATYTYADTFQHHPSGAITSYRTGQTPQPLTHTVTLDPYRYWINAVNAGGVVTATYGHDGVGNVTGLTDSGLGSGTMVYDNVDRLLSAPASLAWGSASFTYDALGNRLTKTIGTSTVTYTYDQAKQQLTGATVPQLASYLHDGAGNLTSETGSAGSFGYTYTPTNLVATATVGAATSQYGYDGDDLRKRRKVGNVTSYYLHGPGNQILSELEQTGSGQVVPKRDYVYAGSRLIASVRPPTLVVSPREVLFAGVYQAAAPTAQTIAISEASGSSRPVQVSENLSWLTASPSAGTTPFTLTLQATTAGLAVGTYMGSVTVTAPGTTGSPANITVRLVVTQSQGLVVQPSSLEFNMTEGEPGPAPGSLLTTASGVSSIGWTATTAQPWLSVTPAMATTTATTPVEVSVNPGVSGTPLPAGTHRGLIKFDGGVAGGSVKFIPVTLIIRGAAGGLCAANSWFCERFDARIEGPLAGQGLWQASLTSTQVEPDPRGGGRVGSLDAPPDGQINDYAPFTGPQLDALEISAQVMTTGVPDDSKQVAKIEFLTREGAGWGKLNRDFGVLRFGSALNFQHAANVYQVLVDRMQPGRWYTVKTVLQGSQLYVYVDGALTFQKTIAPMARERVLGFAMTGWDFPGAAYIDVIDGRPLSSGLVVTPSSLAFTAAQAPVTGHTDGPSARGVANSGSPRTSDAVQAAVRDHLATLPLRFEAAPSDGHFDGKYVTRAKGYDVVLMPDGVTLAGRPSDGASAPPSPAAPVTLRFVGGNRHANVSGMEPLPGRSNYYIGNDPKLWRTNVPQYRKVRYEGVYPGVDVMFYGSGGMIEYDVVLAPGIDPAVVRLAFEGAEDPRVDASGDLVLRTAAGELRQRRANVYQEVDGHRHPVSAQYAVADGQVAFRIEGHDPRRPLVMDPVLTYSTYLGGAEGDAPAVNFDSAEAIAVDEDGNAYIVGYTNSPNFPTVNASQSQYAGGYDAFVSKLSADGSALLFSTYLGGTSTPNTQRIERARDVALDGVGNLYVVGDTTSDNFPQVAPLPQQTCSGSPVTGIGDGFLAKFDASGTLSMSTCIGKAGTSIGSQDSLSGVAVDAQRAVYVTGETYSDTMGWFPGAPRRVNLDVPYPSGADVFVARVLNGTPYLTYLNAALDERVPRIAVDGSGAVHVTGMTLSPPQGSDRVRNPFPASPGGFQQNHGNVAFGDAFVTKLNAAGDIVAYSTYLGGSSQDAGRGVALDPGCLQDCAAYVTGQTSSIGFPTTPPVAWRPVYGGGNSDGFVTKVHPSGSSLVYSTFVGGISSDELNDIAVDRAGSAHVTGMTAGVTSFPPEDCLQMLALPGQGYDALVVKLNPSGSAQEYCAILGSVAGDEAKGIILDLMGGVYAAGGSTEGLGDFPTTPNAFQRVGNAEAFVFKLGDTGSGPPRMRFASTQYRTLEGSGTAAITVTRGGDTTQTSSVYYRTSPGTATAPGDYIHQEGRLTFGQGEVALTITVPIANDAVGEDDEALTITLSDPIGGTVDYPSIATLTIGDDDRPTRTLNIRDRILATGPNWTAASDVSWLSLSAASGTGPTDIIVTANPTGLSPGVHQATIIVTGNTGDSPQAVPVTFTITGGIQ